MRTLSHDVPRHDLATTMNERRSPWPHTATDQPAMGLLRPRHSCRCPPNTGSVIGRWMTSLSLPCLCQFRVEASACTIGRTARCERSVLPSPTKACVKTSWTVRRTAACEAVL